MTNRDIARFFNRLAKIMELHDENGFKIKSYANAYLSLRKIEKDLSTMATEEISAIRGVGKNISNKIEELLQTGTLATYQKYVDKTPEGIVQMLDMKGFGPKKIKVVWKELGIENVGELLYACNENRLVELKGFGLKTQATLKKQLEYFIDSQGKFLFDYLETEANDLEQDIKAAFPNEQISLVGLTKRMMPEVTGIDILSTISDNNMISTVDGLDMNEDGTMLMYQGYPVFLHQVSQDDFGAKAFQMNSGEQFLEQVESIPDGKTEDEVFDKLKLAYVTPEYRESAIAYGQAKSSKV